MKARYIGPSFGVDDLTNGKTYSVLGVEFGNLRVVDDSGEDYLYDALNPAPMEGDSPGGRWEIVKDDAKGTLFKAGLAYSKPMPKEFDGVRLTDGRTGTVVHIHADPARPLAYEVELDNTKMEIITVSAEDIEEVI